MEFAKQLIKLIEGGKVKYKENQMNRVAVVSSNLQSVGYCGGTLEIAFHSGGIYQYFGVPETVYCALLGADSKGRFFHRNIKRVYSWMRVG